jgi:outer membrane protein insertion porin family/translocation and assembly module TamA
MHDDSSTTRVSSTSRRSSSRCSVAPTAVCLAALWALQGCASIPKGRDAVDSVEIVGAWSVDPGALLDKIATAPSPRLFGVWRGVGVEYSIYDPSILQRDLARVERYYRGRGFFEAHVRVARIDRTGADHVSIQLVVDEGPPVNNAAIRIDGLDSVPPAVGDAVRAAARTALPAGKRFDEKDYTEATTGVSGALTDRGYAYAKVEANAQVDLASHTIAYSFAVTPGIPAVYGPLTFVGLDPDGAGPAPQEIKEATLRRVMHLRPGSAFSTAAIKSAEQSLLDLEVFSSAHITPQFTDPPSRVVPLVVQLEPTKLRALRLGGGVEFDAIKTDVHLLAGWEDHNFLGDLRDFSVDFSPGAVLYPYNAINVWKGHNPTFLAIPEEKLRVQLRQPGFLESRTTGFVRPEFSVFPLLVNSTPQPNDGVLLYFEPKGSLGVERRFGKHLFGTFAYNVQSEIPVVYKTDDGCKVDTSVCTPPPIVLAFPQLTVRVDFKDDPVHPHAGFGASIDAQIAGFPGSAFDVRLQPDAQAYIPIARNVTFALNASLGMLFPFNYGDYVKNLGNSDQSTGNTTPPLAKLIGDDKDIETVYFRGFFGGGPSDNRGYPLRGVAPHGWVPFLTPSSASTQTSKTAMQNGCINGTTNTNVGATETAKSDPVCFSPIGGFSMWEASAELRVAVSGPLGTAAFCDTGDVSQNVMNFRFRYLHMSCGAGLRYDTPVGPVRLDIAYRIPFLQLLGCATGGDAAYAQSKCHGDPTFGVQPTLISWTQHNGTVRGSLPVTLAFGIGEAF